MQPADVPGDSEGLNPDLRDGDLRSPLVKASLRLVKLRVPPSVSVSGEGLLTRGWQPPGCIFHKIGDATVIGIRPGPSLTSGWPAFIGQASYPGLSPPRIMPLPTPNTAEFCG